MGIMDMDINSMYAHIVSPSIIDKIKIKPVMECGEIIIYEGTERACAYYSVNIFFFPLVTRNEMTEWCTESFGSSTAGQELLPRWYLRRESGLFYLSFKNEKDRTMFLMRWS
jgi:hypothetical protein